MSTYQKLAESIGAPDDEALEAFRSLVVSGKNTFSLNHKVMEKNVDLAWVEAIEEGLHHVDNILRHPSRTIEDIEAVVPIALSKKITVDSVKHLAQHTNLIQDYDPETQRVTPSKVLNVYKEDTLMTYENKFVNTLIDRLCVFINRRYDKLKEVSKDESVYAMDYRAVLGESTDRCMKVTLSIETTEDLEIGTDGSSSVWERIERIKHTIESYKDSQFCKTMGKAYIRPPVMRTNAIMKNVELKACLVLWQFIESYDKIGYDLMISDTPQKPGEAFAGDFYTLSAMMLMAFRTHTNQSDITELSGKKSRHLAPKVIKKFDKESPADFDLEVGIGESGDGKEKEYSPFRGLPEDALEIGDEIDSIIRTEKAFFEAEAEKARIAREQAEERERKRQEELRRLEEERIAAAIREEQERLERERQERERLLELQRKEQEERERLEREEQQRLEQERIAKERAEREEKERLERIERERIAQEQREKDEAEREERERQEKELAEQRAAEKAARLERERMEAERALRLREERRLIEKKPFEQIYFEYSRDPITVIRRSLHKLLKKMGLIKPRTDLTEEEKGILEIEMRCLRYQQEEEEAQRLEKQLRKEEDPGFFGKLARFFKRKH